MEEARSGGEAAGGGVQDAAARAAAFLAEPQGEQPSPERMAEVQALGEKIVAALKTCYDPEIPVDIYELGLVYRVDVEDDNAVKVEMTLTSPHCPVAETLPVEVKQKVEAVEGVKGCTVEIVWDPPWNPSMMSEEARLELGMLW
ncbi:MAG: SUF system Fe-S cluster assembly protein [Geminicoccaceae bacterium]|nr:SUF system Fe-S cluster assembly protein [Geminicoccaceae bacterium]MCX8101662.1 SUF system Fe-S cluster assembly protein [Geminicoccaceae bacterium]MDW8371676.1 SUF system Fe-S cluster assembly protein [Geminicoccaceae bacterium]